LIAGDAVGVSFTSDTIDLLVVDYSCKSASHSVVLLAHLLKESELLVGSERL